MQRLAHILDAIDEGAGAFIRLAYLCAGVTAVALYFGAGHLPAAVESALNGALPWALAAAVETHTYVTARRVRASWQDLQAAPAGSQEGMRARGALRVNLAVLAGLLLFSCWNQLNYLAATWAPPVTALALPAPVAYAVRALIVPAAFMAAAFLAPLAPPISAEIEAEARATLADVFKIARRQRRRMLQSAERSGQDMTTALVQLVQDPEARRLISHAYAAISPDSTGHTIPAMLTAGSESPPVALLEAPGSLDPERPPTGPGSPSALPGPSGVRTGGKKTSRLDIIKLTPERSARPRKVAARGNAEQRCRSAWRDGITISQLEREASVSRSTAHKWNRVLIGEQVSRTEVAQ